MAIGSKLDGFNQDENSSLGDKGVVNSLQVKAVADAANAAGNNTASSELTAEEVRNLNASEDELMNADLSDDQIDQVRNIMAAIKGSESSDFDKQFEDSSILPASQQNLITNQPVRVGTYSGKVIGNVPIFAAPAAVTPANIIMKRASQLTKAAKARSKASKTAIEKLKFKAPEQFQSHIDNRRKNIIEKYGELTGWNFYKVNDLSTSVGQQYAADVEKIKQELAFFNKYEIKAKEILEQVKDGNTDIPTDVFNLATKFQEEAANGYTKEMMTKIRTGLQAYESRNVALDNAIKVLKPTISPVLDDLPDNAKLEFKDLITQTKLNGNQGKVALTSFIRKYYPKEDIVKVVTNYLESSNVYRKDDKAMLEQSIEYVAAALGESISSNSTIIKQYEAYETPTSTSSTTKDDSTVYNNARIGYDQIDQSTKKSIGSIVYQDDGKAYSSEIKKNVFKEMDNLVPNSDGTWEAPIASKGIIQDADAVNLSDNFIKYEYDGKKYTAQEYSNKLKEEYEKDPNSMDEKDLMTLKTLNGGEEDVTSPKFFTVDGQSTLSGNKKVIINKRTIAFVNSNGETLTDDIMVEISQKATELDESTRESYIAKEYSKYKPTAILYGVVKEPIKQELPKTVKEGSSEDRMDQMEKQFVQLFLNQNTKEQTAYTNSLYAPISWQYPLEGGSSLSFLDALVSKQNTQLKAMDATEKKTNLSSEPIVEGETGEPELESDVEKF